MALRALARDASAEAAVTAETVKPRRRGLWLVYGLLTAALAAYLVSTVVRPASDHSTLLDGWLVDAIEVVACALCIGRGVVRRPDRAVALVLGCSLAAWTLGDVAQTVESLGGATPPTPSVSDLFYLAFYPLAYAAVVLFKRREFRRLASPSWLDGLVAGLGAAAACAAFAFHGV